MTEQIINCRTPGKVILHGEHAVVYGKNAVALSVDLDTRMSAKLFNDSKSVKLLINNFNVWTEWSTDSLSLIKLIEMKENLNKVLEFTDSLAQKLPKSEDKNLSKDVINSYNAFLFLYLGISDSYCGSHRIPLELTVSSSLPIGAGLGSSSSYTVGLTATLFKAYGLSPELSLISEWAFQIDKLFHGRPSGIDNSICTFGGALLFRSGKIVEQLPKVQSLPVILVNTKVSRNTKAQVEKLRQRYDKFTDIVDNILSAIDGISLNAWELIKQNNDLQDFVTLFHMNQHLLNSLNAGHPSIDKIIECAQKYGLSAKLTGAGGGGTVIIFNTLKENKLIDDLFRDLNEFGFEYFSVSLGASGVSFE